MLNLIKHLIIASIAIFAVIMAFVMLRMLVPQLYFYGGMAMFAFGLLANKRRIVVGISVGYGISLSALLISKIITRILPPNAHFAWHSHNAAEVAAYTIFATQHHQAGFLAVMITASGMILGFAFGIGAGHVRVPSKVDGRRIFDPETVINRLLSVPWLFFPFHRELDLWCDGPTPKRVSRPFSTVPRSPYASKP